MNVNRGSSLDDYLAERAEYARGKLGASKAVSHLKEGRYIYAFQTKGIEISHR